MGNDVQPWLEVFAKAAISAIPYAGGSLVIVAEQIASRRAQAANAFAADVAERASIEVLGQALADDPVLEALFMRGVESAVNTGLVAKRRPLARVIAAAVLDDAKVDESHLYTEALRDLDAPRLRGLERFRRAVDAPIPFGATPFGLEPGLRDVWDGEPFPVRATLIRTGPGRRGLEPQEGFTHAARGFDARVASVPVGAGR
jgi:hypothetical protein